MPVQILLRPEIAWSFGIIWAITTWQLKILKPRRHQGTVLRCRFPAGHWLAGCLKQQEEVSRQVNSAQLEYLTESYGNSWDTNMIFKDLALILSNNLFVLCLVHFVELSVHTGFHIRVANVTRLIPLKRSGSVLFAPLL